MTDKTTQRILDALKPKTPTRGEDPTCYCGQAFFDNDLLWRHIVKCDEARTATLAHLRNRRGSRLVALCGTESGYNRHRNHGEPPCEPCRVAMSAAAQRRYATNPKRRADVAKARSKYRARQKAEREGGDSA